MVETFVTYNGGIWYSRRSLDSVKQKNLDGHESVRRGSHCYIIYQLVKAALEADVGQSSVVATLKAVKRLDLTIKSWYFDFRLLHQESGCLFREIFRRGKEETLFDIKMLLLSYILPFLLR